MSNGLQVFGQSGLIQLDITDKITRLVYVRTLGATETGSAVIPGFDSSKGIAVVTCATDDSSKSGHQVRQSGNMVSWKSAGNYYGTSDSPQCPSYLMVFMYG